MFHNVIKPSENKKTYRCPCCKFKTLRGRGHYEICQVCFWEDDGQDEHDAEEVRGGPNGSLSLRKAQTNFGEFAAMDEQFKSKVRKPHADEL
jgi:hypothetical protein